MEHVTLRQWRDSDLEPYAAMNRDPEVMRYFPGFRTHEETKESFDRQRSLIALRGWGLWAVDVDGEFAGFTGLAVPAFDAPFMPCVEIGWRMQRRFWGRGIAYRAACDALAYGFNTLNLPDIVSFTVVTNARSRRLMERLGLTHRPSDDFDHPSFPSGHELQRHVFYRRSRESRPSAST